MQFTFRPVLALVTLVGLAILLTLGSWQLQRLQWKQLLIQKIEMRTTSPAKEFSEMLGQWQEGRDVEFTPVRAQVVVDYEAEAHVFGTWDGEVGWFVFSPAQLLEHGAVSDKVVYINRGFVLADKKNAKRWRSSTTEEGSNATVTIEGLLRTPQPDPLIAGWLKLPNNSEKNEWHQRSPELFAQHHGIEALPVWIDSFGGEDGEGAPLGGTSRVSFNNRHLEYALTWFGLAATLLFVFAAFSIRRREPASGS